MNSFNERLIYLQKEQDELLAKLFEYYSSLIFEGDNLVKYNEGECNFIFKLTFGPLKDYLIEIEDDPYKPVFLNSLSDLKDLYIFIYTPDIASKIFNANQELE